MSDFTAEEKERLKQAFNKIDKNGDGFITANEVKAILAELGTDVPEARVNEILVKCDPDHTGKISFEKFLNGCAIAWFALNFLKTIFFLVVAFKAAYEDNNVFITVAELKKLVKDNKVDVAPARIDELVAACDQDKDGKISFKEFIQALVAFIKANA